VSSSALGGANAKVRVLTPPGWTAGAARTWPTLFLLHGCCEPVDYESWSHFTAASAFFAGKNALVVLPTDGAAGMYSDWLTPGAAPQDWETFHVTEVRQLVERNYHAGTTRAVAGLSAGGYGAFEYAVRHPGMFGAVAAYSGLLNTQYSATPLAIQAMLVRAGLNPYGLWGDPVAQADVWAAHNPYNLVEALRGLPLWVSSGDGSAGPYDAAGSYDVVETGALLTSTSFTDRLAALKIPVTTHYYGAGSHTWLYWNRELQLSWPTLAQGLGLPA
jgi:S-formylglutathione hydrolase FrmB